MRITGRMVAPLARRFYRSDWLHLRERLSELRRHYAGSPPVAAILPVLLIAGEDRRFYRHNGIDFVAIVRACWHWLSQGAHEGASTIEMQLVRVVTGRTERTAERKIREMALALLVSSVVPKTEIPLLYLRVAYFGWRMNGLGEACGTLGVDPTALTPRQAAGLVARLRYPAPRSLGRRRWQQIEARGEHLLEGSIRLARRRHIDLSGVPGHETLLDTPEA
jgi:membrane peptidoglycan carboxypeptidase